MTMTQKIGGILTVAGGKARIWRRPKGVRQSRMTALLAELSAVPGVEAWPLPEPRDMFRPGRLRNHAEILINRTDTDHTYSLVQTPTDLRGP